jgi:hypothetical protein
LASEAAAAPAASRCFVTNTAGSSLLGALDNLITTHEMKSNTWIICFRQPRTFISVLDEAVSRWLLACQTTILL